MLGFVGWSIFGGVWMRFCEEAIPTYSQLNSLNPWPLADKIRKH